MRVETSLILRTPPSALVSYPNRLSYTVGDAESQDELIAEIDRILDNNNSMVLNAAEYAPGCAVCRSSTRTHIPHSPPNALRRATRVHWLTPATPIVPDDTLQLPWLRRDAVRLRRDEEAVRLLPPQPRVRLRAARGRPCQLLHHL